MASMGHSNIGQLRQDKLPPLEVIPSDDPTSLDRFTVVKVQRAGTNAMKYQDYTRMVKLLNGDKANKIIVPQKTVLLETQRIRGLGALIKQSYAGWGQTRIEHQSLYGSILYKNNLKIPGTRSSVDSEYTGEVLRLEKGSRNKTPNFRASGGWDGVAIKEVWVLGIRQPDFGGAALARADSKIESVLVLAAERNQRKGSWREAYDMRIAIGYAGLGRICIGVLENTYTEYRLRAEGRGNSNTNRTTKKKNPIPTTFRLVDYMFQNLRRFCLPSSKKTLVPRTCIEDISRTRFGYYVEEDNGYRAVVVGSPGNYHGQWEEGQSLHRLGIVYISTPPVSVYSLHLTGKTSGMYTFPWVESGFRSLTKVVLEGLSTSDTRKFLAVARPQVLQDLIINWDFKSGEDQSPLPADIAAITHFLPAFPFLRYLVISLVGGGSISLPTDLSEQQLWSIFEPLLELERLETLYYRIPLHISDQTTVKIASALPHLKALELHLAARAGVSSLESLAHYARHSPDLGNLRYSIQAQTATSHFLNRGSSYSFSPSVTHLWDQ
ncbi:hypothetical protein BDP27DRAFT_1366033 [Rhodocollybia butyracea]|uniref:Uncharacterized protein n=1 Tax=Rhodocollybia butyracea TaxID=206335 RepID=A0A9P5PMF2_9AGAR|nr:hypothetical protein BDP27DRAFT_1366033 [Rhodocollybia butyracea]